MSSLTEPIPLKRDGVVLVDIQIPFWAMVTFMVKWGLATILAALILFVLGMLLAAPWLRS